MGSRVGPLSESLAGQIAQGSDAGLAVPDTAEPMVVRSLRIPLRLAEALENEAAARGLGVTVLMRQLLEQAVAEPGQQQFVSLDEAITVLSGLARRMPPTA